RGMMVNGIPVTLVGIAAPGFYGERRDSYPPDLWMPLAMEPALHRENTMLRAPRTSWLYVMGRLRPGTPLPQVSAHLTAERRQYLSLPGNLRPAEKPAHLKTQ